MAETTDAAARAAHAAYWDYEFAGPYPTGESRTDHAERYAERRWADPDVREMWQCIAAAVLAADPDRAALVQALSALDRWVVAGIAAVECAHPDDETALMAAWHDLNAVLLTTWEGIERDRPHLLDAARGAVVAGLYQTHHTLSGVTDERTVPPCPCPWCEQARAALTGED